MKKVLAIALSLCMVLSLAACGGSSSGSATTTQAAAAAENTAADPGETSSDSSSDEDFVYDGDPIVISVSHSYTELDQISKELETAAENIHERTNGAVTVNLYPDNTLGNMADGAEAVMAGSPLLLVTAFSQWEDMYYDASAFQCGFVFENGQEFLDVMETDLFKDVVKNMDEIGIHAMNCAFVGGMRHVIGKKPFIEPEDMAGLKIRVPAATSYIECFEAIGASPMGMAAAEQLNALSSGTIDALDQSISLMYSTKSYELVDTVTLLSQQPLADALFCSSDWWYSLPQQFQDIIDEEMHNAGIRYSEYCVENEAAMRAEMEDYGVKFYEADRDAYMVLGGDLVLKFGIGQELLDTLEEIRESKR